ncbi:glycosyltransferase [Saccharibacter floricola DSM 15669]|uniref:Glycosyltransferase n=2 Tax=Saccharibacter TaxID=231052 RepID=A0ABQ0NXI0_9PROT|nr:glycosyltransferase family 25 protein [Saccharibacter floricola]GBQ05845.1 glycosyltransferase [Saccharibacter floricola DSM 15669]
MPMQKYVISLARTPERLERFRRVNAHVPDILHAPGIDGSTLDLTQAAEQGFVDHHCQFTKGAIGSGMTHVSLWGATAKYGHPSHIFEDDAFLCHNFEEESDRVIRSLPEDWDIILWGNNSDTILHYDLLPGITDCVARFSEEKVRRAIETFRHMDVATLPFRLRQTFGICGYSVSPKGAVELIKRCLPFTSPLVTYPSMGGKVLQASSVDHLMNQHYADLKAYTCMPPLVLTDNVQARSLNLASGASS